MPDEKIQKIPIKYVLVSERNTRQPKETDPDVISLGKSMKTQGQTTPGIARPHPKKKGYFELGAGARRRTACPLAGLETIDLIIRDMTDAELDALILVENFQRLDPDPRAEAEVLARLVAEGLTPAEIAGRLGKLESWVQRRLKLLDVIPEIRKAWAKDGSPFHHFNVEMMEFVGSLPPATQKEFFKDPYPQAHSRSRRELEGKFAELLCRVDAAPFDMEDPRFFNGDCGPGCKNSSAKAGMLFDFASSIEEDLCSACV